MLNEETSTQIHESIINGQFEAALDIIETVGNSDATHAIIMLRMRIRAMEKKLHLGTADSDDLDTERNKIVAAILNLLAQLQAEAPVQPTTSDTAAELTFFEQVLDLLEMTNVAFQAQTRQRKRLVQALKNRIENLSYENIPDLLFGAYDTMEAQEKRLHKVIRGYTELIRKNNLKTLQLLEKHPIFLPKVAKMKYLKKHLTVWNSKYESIFEEPSVCLIYVGVDERLRFPVGIEDAIRAHVAELGKE